MRTPDVELLWWEGCPSTERVLGELRAVLKALDLDQSSVRRTEIRTDAEASRAGFLGSPTVLIDGTDVVPESDATVGLNCRVYRRRDGRISPTPDPQDIHDALQRAATQER